MSRKVYAIGDTVTLKADLFRSMDGERLCRIVGVLPSDHGEAQYRIRLGGENHERRIVGSDIEAPETATPKKGAGALPAPHRNEPWFKPSSIRIHK